MPASLTHPFTFFTRHRTVGFLTIVVVCLLGLQATSTKTRLITACLFHSLLFLCAQRSELWTLRTTLLLHRVENAPSQLQRCQFHIACMYWASVPDHTCSYMCLALLVPPFLQPTHSLITSPDPSPHPASYLKAHCLFLLHLCLAVRRHNYLV